MSNLPEYKRGYQDGIRVAVTWLHRRAKQMDDPHAVQVLNSAATNLGWALNDGHLQHIRIPAEPPPAPEEE